MITNVYIHFLVAVNIELYVLGTLAEDTQTSCPRGRVTRSKKDKIEPIC